VVSEYPVKGRGGKGVLTAKLTAKKGGLAGALIVRPHQELIFISQNGMVQRTGVSGISRMGRPTQGVRVMDLKAGDKVSAVALVVESAAGEGNGSAPVEGAEGEAGIESPATDGAGVDGAGDGAAVETKPKREAAEPKKPAKDKPERKPKAKSKSPPKTKPKPKTAKATSKPKPSPRGKAKPKANPPLASSRKRSKKRS
jgi:DNA gyrase subunit A